MDIREHHASHRADATLEYQSPVVSRQKLFLNLGLAACGFVSFFLVWGVLGTLWFLLTSGIDNFWAEEGTIITFSSLLSLFVTLVTWRGIGLKTMNLNNSKTLSSGTLFAFLIIALGAAALLVLISVFH